MRWRPTLLFGIALTMAAPLAWAEPASEFTVDMTKPCGCRRPTLAWIPPIDTDDPWEGKPLPDGVGLGTAWPTFGPEDPWGGPPLAMREPPALKLDLSDPWAPSAM